MMASPDSPIGVFDSGVGGLSIFRSLLSELPSENYVYVADSAHAPYGERNAAHVLARSQAITRYLVTQHRIKLLVVACNTATAAAIEELRQSYPDLPIVGVEPALKPAAAQSLTRRIAVMATRGTLDSPKFKVLAASLPEDLELHTAACDGLADAIEHGETSRIDTLCRQAIAALGSFGAQSGQIDQLVLGCTHYTFVINRLRKILPANVSLQDSGEPVARQTRRLLEAKKLLNENSKPQRQWLVTGEAERLKSACREFLQIDAEVQTLLI
jgi:glutamate racemase